MRAAIIAVGSELLGTDRLDTNSLRLTTLLRRYGVDLAGKTVAGDSHEELHDIVRYWLDRVELLLLSGGLGPTRDDLTREAVAAAVGTTLSEDPAIVREIREKFASMGLEMPDVNRRQAKVLGGAMVLANPRGTAPGQRLDLPGRTLFLFPGVPSELDELADDFLEPWLAEFGAGNRIESRSLRVACRSESAVEEMLRPLYEAFDPAAITVLASPGDIEVRCTVTGSPGERDRRLETMLALARRSLGRAVYAEGRDATLEAVVGQALRDAGATIATAESCSGGLLAERLTRVAGSSGYFEGGFVTYSNRAKTKLLGVEPALFELHGAVSEPVALAMARGAASRLGCSFGVGITGIAGPDGGTADKPVGTVHVGVAGPDAESHRELHLPGDRRRVRRLSTQWALELVRRALLTGR